MRSNETAHRISSIYGDMSVVELLAGDSQLDYAMYAMDIQHLINHAWKQRFVPQALSEQAIDVKADSANANLVSQQEEKLRRRDPKRPMHYWVAQHDVGIDGLCAVEEYSPRNPLKKMYPNVTDLEVYPARESLRTPRQQASVTGAAVLYWALEAFRQEGKVSHYSEEPNTEGIEWFRSLGFEQTTLRPTEQLTSDESITYVQLIAPAVSRVRHELARQFPEITVAGTV